MTPTGGESSLRRRLMMVSERHGDRKLVLPMRIIGKNGQNYLNWRLRSSYRVSKEAAWDQRSCDDVPDLVACLSSRPEVTNLASLWRLSGRSESVASDATRSVSFVCFFCSWSESNRSGRSRMASQMARRNDATLGARRFGTEMPRRSRIAFLGSWRSALSGGDVVSEGWWDRMSYNLSVSTCSTDVRSALENKELTNVDNEI